MLWPGNDGTDESGKEDGADADVIAEIGLKDIVEDDRDLVDVRPERKKAQEEIEVDLEEITAEDLGESVSPLSPLPNPHS